MSVQSRANHPVLPGVNLLPPEVHQRRDARRLRSWLVVAVGVVLALTVVGILWATGEVTAAEDRLQEAQDANERMRAEEATYWEVPVVLAELENAESAETVAMWREILWEPYALELLDILPEDVSIERYEVQNPGAVEGMLAARHPLETESYSFIQFEGYSYIRPDVADWIEAIEGVDAFQYAWVDVIELDGELDGLPATEYRFTGSVDVNGAALSERYLPEETITSPDTEVPPAADADTDNEDGDE